MTKPGKTKQKYTVPLPVILSGPIVRRTTPTELVIWLCTSRPLDWVLELYLAGTDQPFAL